MSFFDTHFKIIVTCYNASENITKTLESIKGQSYYNFECVVVDDNSDDDTSRIVSNFIKNDSRFNLVCNNKQQWPCEGRQTAIRASTNPQSDDVIVLVDGDDWLANDNTLQYVARQYVEKDCWCSFGSWEDQNGVRCSWLRDYTPTEKKFNLFRDTHWVGTALRTFKYFLWEKVAEKDLLNENGEYWKCATDYALFMPILEMAGEKACFFEEVLYVYNRNTSLNMDKIYPGQQLENEAKLRKKKKYRPLGSEVPSWSIGVPSYNDADLLKKFLYSCLGVEGLDDIYVVDHRSTDHTQSVLEEMQGVCKDNNIDLRWEYCEQDFSPQFTMSDLRNLTFAKCNNDIVSCQDADNVLGPNMSEMIRVASIKFKTETDLYAIGYELPCLYEDATIQNNIIVSHGFAALHPSVARIMLKDYFIYRQTHMNGRHLWCHPTDSARTRWTTIPIFKSSNMSVAKRSSDQRNRLRSVQNDYFEKVARKEISTDYVKSFEAGILGKGKSGQERRKTNFNKQTSIVGENFNFCLDPEEHMTL